MKKYTFTVSMRGYESVSGICSADSLFSAQILALTQFFDHNDMQDADGLTNTSHNQWGALIKFYAPKVTLKR